MIKNLKNLENSVEGHFKDSKGNLEIFKSKYMCIRNKGLDHMAQTF